MAGDQVAKRRIGAHASNGARRAASQPSSRRRLDSLPMPDPSIARFRRVISSAYASLEARRQEVNDLNVFPVADGDTGDNMAMTMRAVMEELDRLDGLEVDEVGRTELVQALARAALMGARGNSGVILSQIVRGAAEELASRPGELVDPVLVASAFASAADAAYESVREPAEGTMLTVFREMAHSLARQLAHLEADKQRLGRDVSEDAAGRDPRRGPGAGDRRRRAGGRADARAARGAARVRRRRRRRLRPGADPRRGRRRPARRRRRAARGLPPRAAAAQPAPPRGQPLPLLHQLHRLRQRPRRRATSCPGWRALGDSVLVVGDEATLKVHVHTDEPGGGGGAVRGRRRGHQPRRRRHARADRRARAPGWRPGAPACSRSPPARGWSGSSPSSAPTSSPAARRSTPRPTSCWPGSTSVAGRGGAGPAQLLERDHGRRARLRALREAGAGGRRRPPSRRACWPWSSSTRRLGRRERRAARRRRWRASPPAASPRPPATTPRDASSRATRSASPTARSSPGAAPARP